MKLVISVVIFVFGFSAVFGQTTGIVEGKVEMGGLPVADAVVLVATDGAAGQRFTTRTSDDGTFKLAAQIGRAHV